MSTADAVDLLDMFGYVMDDSTRMPKGARSLQDHSFGLTAIHSAVLCDGNPDMGIPIDVDEFWP